MRSLVAAALVLVPACPALAAEYIPPPILPVPSAWQGRATGQVRVLDKLDAHVELLTLPAGQTGHYKSLAVTLRSCMDRPDGMPRDSAAFLDVQDAHGNGQPFTGWTFSNEPAIGVFESPVYAVQLVGCQGAQVAPAAPPLPAPVPAPPGLVHDTPPPAADAPSGDAATPDGADPSQPDTVSPDQPAPGSGNAPAAGGTEVDPGSNPPGSTAPAPGAAAPQPDSAPDAVYPDGAPPKQP